MRAFCGSGLRLFCDLCGGALWGSVFVAMSGGVVVVDMVDGMNWKWKPRSTSQ